MSIVFIRRSNFIKYYVSIVFAMVDAFGKEYFSICIVNGPNFRIAVGSQMNCKKSPGEFFVRSRIFRYP